VSDTPIGDHALLSDCHGAALVDRDGTVAWWCVPRFDSPSVFAYLLDEAAGHHRIAPVAPARVERRYVADSLVLVTTFHTASGVLAVTDALAMAEGVRAHELGAGSPGVLLRRAVCTQGVVDVDVVFCPRFEYGLTTPAVHCRDGRLVAYGGPVRLSVSADVDLTINDGAAGARQRLSAGESLATAVAYTSTWQPPGSAWTGEEIAARLDDTTTAWQSWARSHQRYDGPYADLVNVSGRVLQALTYQPTGAIVAAPTTSLPECVGGPRNWDYRYTWVRDASLTLDALWVVSCPDEAGAFMRYLATVATTFRHTGDLQIMFGITGKRDLSERTLDHLAGWRDSDPVRVGNGAWNQRQLDAYGQVLAAVSDLRAQMAPFDEVERRFLVAAADTAAARWTEADQGIWEIRGPARHFLHSKLLCWVALDRAIDLAPLLGAQDRVADWTITRQRIAEAILDRGWSDEAQAFTQSFDTHELDASSLLISLFGFLPGDDPRVVATIAATEAYLTDQRGLVYRYRNDDGLAGQEGAFLLCTFWLAEAMARAGEPARGREVFERAAAHANDVGLLAEEADSASGELLGNFPQAFSHIGVINAAWAIQQAERDGDGVSVRPCDLPWDRVEAPADTP
jgi:GH15 family glucan-1,4-alpha-glucosidase